jgi:hypothetical protein
MWRMAENRNLAGNSLAEIGDNIAGIKAAYQQVFASALAAKNPKLGEKISGRSFAFPADRLGKRRFRVHELNQAPIDPAAVAAQWRTDND